MLVGGEPVTDGAVNNRNGADITADTTWTSLGFTNAWWIDYRTYPKL